MVRGKFLVFLKSYEFFSLEKDLQNVLRLLQTTESSLKTDEESNVEVDFETLKPKTLVALRKYVNSCMLNAKKINNSSHKKFCHSLNSSLPSLNASDIETNFNNSFIKNWSHSESILSDLQLSESSSDSELD